MIMSLCSAVKRTAFEARAEEAIQAAKKGDNTPSGSAGNVDGSIIMAKKEEDR